MVPQSSFLSEFRRGFLDIAPLTLGVVPFALLFGTLAAQKGLSPLETVFMCASVYAGGAQFVSIEVWAHPVPVLAVIAATALANSRYLLMGAALRPHLQTLPLAVRLGFVGIHSDETWALALRRRKTHELTSGYVFGLVGFFYLNWPFWCGVGAVFGGAIDDPARFGADFMFAALFIGLIRGLWQGRSSLLAICAAALTAWIVHRYIPGHWYIFAGAVAGMAAAALSWRGVEPVQEVEA